MVVLRETERAFADLAANSMFSLGQHTDGRPRTGVDGIYIGTSQFDPARHSATDIDPISLMGVATGEDYVRDILPGKPLMLNLVVDNSRRIEHAGVTAAKERLATDLATAIEHALPGMTDRLFPYVIGEPKTSALPAGTEKLNTDALTLRSLGRLAASGLTFVLSDFNRVQLDTSMPGRLANLIAIKVNHPAERVIPAGVGMISLGEFEEVNTNKPKQVKDVNQKLEAKHLRITSDLEQAGASVVSIITAPNGKAPYDTRTADRDLAGAIRRIK